MTIFEKIIARQIPAKIIWEDEDAIAFHDVDPQAPVHVLIVPKKAVPRLADATDEDAALLGMGSTLTAARSCGRDLLIVHVGDSRAYLLRDGRLERLTRDHTYAQLLVDAGQLSPRDVALSGVRHILTNALGGSTKHVHVDVDLLRLEDGDRLLLCSDGLTDGVDDDTIAATLGTALPSSEICQRFLQLALDHGGRDNITVVVAVFEVTNH